jgi:hypothetical protein
MMQIGKEGGNKQRSVPQTGTLSQLQGTKRSGKVGKKGG